MILYDSIDDMPIFNWFKCVEKSEYKYCLKSGEYDEVICKEQFGLLYGQFIDKYGINENLAEIIRLQNKILVHKINLVVNEDRSELTFIEIAQIELDNLLNIKESKSNTAKVAIEKYLGCQINTKQTSVVEYYDYIEAIKQDKNGRG